MDIFEEASFTSRGPEAKSFGNMFWDEYSRWKHSVAFTKRHIFLYVSHVVEAEEDTDIAELMDYFLFKTVLTESEKMFWIKNHGSMNILF